MAASISSRAEQYIILLYIHIYGNSYEPNNHMSDGLYDSCIHMIVAIYESNLMYIECINQYNHAYYTTLLFVFYNLLLFDKNTRFPLKKSKQNKYSV